MLDDDTRPQELLKKYFIAWRRRIKIKKDKLEMAQVKLEQREKLDNLMKALRKHKKELTKQSEEFDNQTLGPNDKFTIQNNYKNRFEAQKQLITKLTSTLQQKNKMIEDLKLGVIDKQALKSIEETKVEIREIFSNCSAKTRCKIAPPVDFNEEFMISTQKMPRMVQKTQERALERAQKREIIQERKRVIEETRRRMIAEAIENKRVQDDEDKRRNLQVIKERRRRELEREKIRQTNKLIYLEKLKRAECFYNRKIVRTCFNQLKQNRTDNKLNYLKSVLHYKNKLLTSAMCNWKDLVEEQYKDKYKLAEQIFAWNILSKCLRTWKEYRLNCVRSWQVAEDLYDFRLQNKVFVHWHRYVCVQIMEREKKIEIAEQHHRRKITFQCFHQWRSLPVVLQLEKAKEEKKRKWRQKVWEVLPDYKPPILD